MALRCAVPNCGSRYKKDQGILIYPFPENEIIKFKWILKIPRQRRDIGPETGVCSLHFLQRDINSDNELLAHAIPSVFENLFIPPNVLKLSKPQYIVFYKVHFDPKSIAEMEFTLYIHNDLTFNVYHKFSDLKNIPLPNYKFFNLTEIRDLLFALNSIQYSPSSEELSLKKPIELIRGVDCESMEERLKVDFLLEQLEMLSCAPHERQFSLNTLTSANIWKNRCSTVYEMLCNYLTLPDICLDDIQDEVRDFSRSYLKG
ncbi:unnamed protein product [Lepeophtheirus salmonis]|uniref:(salmon louse) hypothetical protein n=1 Tax=Lepeophtheirus salmonis TaxID=72036 RepID=A0A7R8H7T6_LEPSM|nr:unnamed protein product [Lepeophtheirus salmonis]CAF2924963.1 unnamed protein product [Lepeophtheirus salmonis]